VEPGLARVEGGEVGDAGDGVVVVAPLGEGMARVVVAAEGGVTARVLDREGVEVLRFEGGGDGEDAVAGEDGEDGEAQ